jgi:hypothetical protein
VAEEYGKAEGEVVGRVSRVREELTGDLELAVPNRNKNALFIELGDQPRYYLISLSCIHLEIYADLQE